jgi:Flp pilus assembly protein TadB
VSRNACGKGKRESKMKRNRIFLWIQTIAVVLVCVLFAASAIRIYREGMQARALDASAWIYTREIVKDALTEMLPAITGAAILVIFGRIADRKNKSSRKEDLSVKGAADGTGAGKKNRKKRQSEPVTLASMEDRAEWYSSGDVKPSGMRKAICVLLLIIAVLCILYGLYNGSARDVLIKAAAVCTECIGLG